MTAEEIRDRYGSPAELIATLAKDFYLTGTRINIADVSRAYGISTALIYQGLKAERREKNYPLRDRRAMFALPDRCEIFRTGNGRYSWEMMSGGTVRPRALSRGYVSEQCAREAWAEFIELAAGCDDYLQTGQVSLDKPAGCFWLISFDKRDQTWSWEFVTPEKGAIAECNAYGYQSRRGLLAAISDMRPRLIGCKIELVDYCVYRGVE